MVLDKSALNLKTNALILLFIALLEHPCQIETSLLFEKLEEVREGISINDNGLKNYKSPSLITNKVTYVTFKKTEIRPYLKTKTNVRNE